jgi:hypothetical protein
MSKHAEQIEAVFADGARKRPPCPEDVANMIERMEVEPCTVACLDALVRRLPEWSWEQITEALEYLHQEKQIVAVGVCGRHAQPVFRTAARHDV